jgi:hypothetical protein
MIAEDRGGIQCLFKLGLDLVNIGNSGLILLGFAAYSTLVRVEWCSMLS